MPASLLHAGLGAITFTLAFIEAVGSGTEPWNEPLFDTPSSTPR